MAWAERIVTEVVPDVPYLQTVFTIPKMLRKHFLFDRALYGELSRVAYAATREFFAAQFPSIEVRCPAGNDQSRPTPLDEIADLVIREGIGPTLADVNRRLSG